MVFIWAGVIKLKNKIFKNIKKSNIYNEITSEIHVRLRTPVCYAFEQNRRLHTTTKQS
jgi:hypothetical protein